jgi:hypothetical protein
VATVLLKLPLLRHVFAWMGCVPADYHTLKELLQVASIGIVPEVGCRPITINITIAIVVITIITTVVIP